MMAPTYIEATLHSQRDHIRHLQLHSQRLQAIKSRNTGLKRWDSEPRVRCGPASAQTAVRIEAGNRRLMLKLLAIDGRKRSDFCIRNDSFRSLNEVSRRHRTSEIAYANSKLALRLIKTPCEVSYKQLAKEYRSSLKYRQLSSRVLQLERVNKTLQAAGVLSEQRSVKSLLVKQRAKSVQRLGEEHSVKL